MLNTFKRKVQEGFTLVEILIVVVIVGILAAIAIPTYFKYVEKAYASDANTQIKTLFEECKIWKTTHADFPTDLDMMEQEGAANVSASTKLKWDLTWKLEVNTDGDIEGFMKAESLEGMSGGEGETVCYDALTGKFSGYGTKDEPEC